MFDLTTEHGAGIHNNNLLADSDECTTFINGYYNPSAPGRAFLHFLGYYKCGDGIYRRFEHHQSELIMKICEVECMLKRAGFTAVEYYCYGVSSLQRVSEPDFVGNVVIKAGK